MCFELIVLQLRTSTSRAFAFMVLTLSCIETTRDALYLRFIAFMILYLIDLMIDGGKAVGGGV